ncbi:hypothetical protein VNI00_013127 [Paramarasmius palmivorus]|uniref:AB hydrolase-1 domain-containing protein n=1 Tax=Paramarasmius palmivorus TaxID=297713 RepID=A0AAW0BZ67_9AGAR
MRRGIRLVLATLLSLLGGGTLAVDPSQSPSESAHLNPRLDWTEASWASIEPSKELAWVKCYDGTFECARLQVPLDYSNPESQSAAIALIRIKSSVSTDSPDYLGPVLYNPGGPGVSGIDLVLGIGQSLVANVLGPEFDFVGFDPRGIARSTPRVSWYETRVERQLWSQPTVKELNHSSDNVASYWTRTKITGQLAEERASDILPYMQTDFTARDMLSIVEAHGREKLQFWGFSYGTVLGATFATLFPDKVHWMVMDGVVDVDDYYIGDRLTALADSDDTLQWFFRDCHSAGPDLCSFYQPSPEAIEERLNNLYDAIIRAPVAVRTERSYGLVDYERLRQTVWDSLSFSFNNWIPLANGLADLEAGNGTALYRILETDPFECSCDPSEYAFENIEEGGLAVGCNDGAVAPETLEEAERHYENALRISEWGSVWGSSRLACSFWPDIPKTFFRGPISGNTSHPILLIGNTADPVTPLQSAITVSKAFPGSVVLTQDSAGVSTVQLPFYPLIC